MPLSRDGVVGTYHCALLFSPRHFYLKRSCKGFFIHSALSQMLGMYVSYMSPMARCGLGRGLLTQRDFSNIPLRCFPWPRNRSEQPIREPMAWYRSVRREPEVHTLKVPVGSLFSLYIFKGSVKLAWNKGSQSARASHTGVRILQH